MLESDLNAVFELLLFKTERTGGIPDVAGQQSWSSLTSFHGLVEIGSATSGGPPILYS